MICLGVDPARGWALVEHKKRHRSVLDAGTVKDVPELTEKIQELAGRYRIDKVRIERPAGRHVYARAGQTERKMQKIAVNVGENRAKAEAVYWFCTGMGLDTAYVPVVRNGTKLSPLQIELITGWTGKTSEHARDAIMLAWI